MHERCAACGLRYEREQGYFVGAIYINYAVTVAVAVSVVLVLNWTVGLTLASSSRSGWRSVRWSRARSSAMPRACGS